MLTTVLTGLALGLGWADAPSFDRDILPILSDRCFPCHGPDPKSRKGDLRLDVASDALRKENPVIIPGKAADSELIKRLISTEPSEVMPPPKFGKPITPEQRELLSRWIDSGAAWGKHWSLVAPVRPPLPSVKRSDWAVQPWDRFVLARLEKQGWSPSREAPKETYIRRVKLDLLGVPPTPKEVDAFLADDRPGARERLVDRFLASPQFGERMAWDWLDAARYADSNGYQGDAERTMWPWRDWVVEAFNKNLPFDQFSIWQLAGDLMPGATEEQILATGFCRNHMINGEGGRIPEENRIEYLFDQTETLGTVWLGLTFNCARCHDHKFDPLPSRDYYGLLAFFNQTPVDGGGGNPQTPPVLAVASPEQKQGLALFEKNLSQAADAVEDWEKRLVASKAPGAPHKGFSKKPKNRTPAELDELIKAFSPSQPTYGASLQSLKAAIQGKESLERNLPKVMVMRDMPTPRKTFFLAKGQYNQPTQELSASVPAAIAPWDRADPLNRLGLARWLFRPDHPLTARVTVNRFWTQFFGQGLVKTAEDFGIQGERPVHQELLDWLSVDFRESGWDVKRLVKSIVLSATYRQESKVGSFWQENDPENRLYGRGPRFRMPSWMIRDQALAVSGLLVEKRGGPPVHPYQPPGIWEEATFGNKTYKPDQGPALYRRSLYTFWRRIVGPTMIFDNATRQVCTVKVFRTNTPLHALLVLNDPTQVDASIHLAQTILRQNATSDRDRLVAMHRKVLGRKPQERELAVLAESLAAARKQFSATPGEAKKLVAGDNRESDLPVVEHAAWTSLAMVLLNLDETLTKE